LARGSAAGPPSETGPVPVSPRSFSLESAELRAPGGPTPCHPPPHSRLCAQPGRSDRGHVPILPAHSAAGKSTCLAKRNEGGRWRRAGPPAVQVRLAGEEPDGVIGDRICLPSEAERQPSPQSMFLSEEEGSREVSRLRVKASRSLQPRSPRSCSINEDAGPGFLGVAAPRI